jgi:hypothetical protein
MSSSPLPLLRRHPARRTVSILAALALMWAGFALAAHVHRVDSARGVDTHPQCLLCLHIDRGAAPPELPRISEALLAGGSRVLPPTASTDSQQQPRPYDARGPPRV